MLKWRQQSERDGHDDREHESAQCEVGPKTLRMNVIRIKSNGVECEGGHRDRGDVPEVEGHRSSVADGAMRFAMSASSYLVTDAASEAIASALAIGQRAARISNAQITK